MNSYSRAAIQTGSFRNVILTTMLAGSAIGGGPAELQNQPPLSAAVFPQQTVRTTGVIGESAPSLNFRLVYSNPESLEEVMGRLLLDLQNEDSLTPDMERVLFSNRMALYEA
jgi:hypothetical protein